MSKMQRDKNETVTLKNNQYSLSFYHNKKPKDPSYALDYKSFYRMALQDPDMQKYQVNDWFGLKLGVAFAFKYGFKLMLFTIRHLKSVFWKYKKQTIVNEDRYYCLELL